MLQKKLTSNFLLWWGGRSAEQRVRFATAGRNLYRTANRSEQLYFPVATVVSFFTRPACVLPGRLVRWSAESRGLNCHAALLEDDIRIVRISRKISDEPSNC